MGQPIRLLLQTTIPFTEDDWHIGRFSKLAGVLSATDGVEVTARNRETPGGETDPVLGALDSSDFDEMWLFAVDTGDGLNSEECAALGRFRKRGGGLMVTRDHMDLGSSVCTLGGVGEAHYFHSKNPDPDPSRNARDDQADPRDIDWPNYHSGSNGDFQEIASAGAPHPVLNGVTRLPSHPHEGAVGAPAKHPSARVISTGKSQSTGRPFNIAVAFEPSDEGGRAIAESTFHHFADYNLDPSQGAPSFVSEAAPGDGFCPRPHGARRDPSLFQEPGPLARRTAGLALALGAAVSAALAQAEGDLGHILPTDARAVLVIEEGHEDEPLALGHRRRLMQQAAGEHRGPADRRTIGARAELREPQLAALVAVVEVQRDGEPAMRRAGGGVVAVAGEEPQLLLAVAADQVALDVLRLPAERAPDHREQPVLQARGDRV